MTTPNCGEKLNNNDRLIEVEELLSSNEKPDRLLQFLVAGSASKIHFRVNPGRRKNR